MGKLITLNNGTSVNELDLLPKIASYIYCTSAMNTRSNVWFIDFSDIEEQFNLPIGFIDNAIAEQIKTVLCKEFENQISECRIYYSQDKRSKK